MYQRITLSKPIAKLSISTWEISNFLSGLFLAKACAILLANESSSSEVKEICAYIIEFSAPIVIILGVITFFHFLNLSKLEKSYEMGPKKEIKKHIEMKKVILHSLVCAMVGFGAYLLFVLLLASVIISSEQLHVILKLGLEQQWSIAFTMSLIWGNIIKFTTYYDI